MGGWMDRQTGRMSGGRSDYRKIPQSDAAEYLYRYV